MSMDINTHGMVEEQECGGRLEAGGTDVMVLIQTETGATNGEVRNL